ncbi:DUF4255 domain-containing protein [Chromobacterium subtsugae]|uniref:DUF4255 domain-containing protein n=1 Tax=Chromobacterium subtsugae TaxID=251747 RepID=UPI000640F503|nr:DUF4255 domain-containing protein [Chromobacterium subtsugae]
MIDSALNYLAEQLNQHFRRRFMLAEDIVLVSDVQDASGQTVEGVNGKLLLFLGGISREIVQGRAGSVGEFGSRLQGVDPVYLRLSLVCAAVFSGKAYHEGLKLLSEAIAFFQSHPVFDHQNAPGLESGLDRLMLNLENLSAGEMHSLWSIHGGRYLPSVLYQLRLICLDGATLSRRTPLVRSLETDTRPQ